MIRHAILFSIITAIFVHQTKAQTKGHIFNSVVGNNSEPVLYNAYNLNTYELLTTNIQVRKVDNLQKIVLTPLKLSEKGSVSWFRETKLNLAQKDGISTIGIGLGFDNSSPYSKRGDGILSRVTLGTIPTQNPGETTYDYEIRKALVLKKNKLVYANAYKEMLENSFKLTLGYNVSLFEIIGGDDVDLDQNSLIDNYHTTESHNYSAGLTYVFSLKSAVSATLHYSERLASPEEGKKIVDYVGGSISVAKRVLVLNKKYEDSDDYLSGLFVPSVVVGLSFEYQKAVSNEEFAKDGITNSQAVTPFAEFKINPKNQFRIGIPIKKLTGIKDETSIGPFLQWTLQIAQIE